MSNKLKKNTAPQQYQIMDNNSAEMIRLKYKYRELILKKKINLPHKKASKLIGPDCAYHLYSGFSGKE